MSIQSAAEGACLNARFSNAPNEGFISAGRVASLLTLMGSRPQNQDRAFVAFLSPRSGQGRFVAAVLDGMGGMEEGAKAASIAASTFIQSLATSFNIKLGAALAMAMSEANAAVWATLCGHGGTTLTAIAISESGQCLAVHVGDSRLYIPFPGPGQITIDDSPSGMFGTDLGLPSGGIVQFVGIGDGMRYQGIDLTDQKADQLLLTTDGFHGAADKGLAAIIGKPRTLTAAALWRFGERLPLGDNATAVLMSRGRALAQLGRMTKDAVIVTSTTEREQR